MQERESKPSGRLRALLILGALALLAIWGATLPSAVRAWTAPRGDPFELIPTFYASLTMLPLGLVALGGAIVGSEKAIRRARISLIVAGGCIALVLALEIFRRLTILIDG